MTTSTIFRTASNIESACGKRLDRLPERSAGWARTCVLLAKRAQAAAEAGRAASASSWMGKLRRHLERTGHAGLFR